MKRAGNIYHKVWSIDNLRLADERARKGKVGKQRAIREHDKNADANLIRLQQQLIQKTYRTSEYITFTITDPKERVISRLPYYPDRIVHHAIMNVLEPMFRACYTADTYSCIKGRGLHAAVRKVKECLKDVEGTKYCLKLDVKKFYPSIDHEILKEQLRRKIKDQDMLWLLDEIVDSAEGLPIGNYLSQHLSNFYLTGFDHWLKEVKKVKYYFRYADDMVILSSSKEELHGLLAEIREYLQFGLHLQVKNNYQIFPVGNAVRRKRAESALRQAQGDSGSLCASEHPPAPPSKGELQNGRGIDFVGYVFRHPYTRLRKRIKQRMARMYARKRNTQSIAAYNGMSKWCDSKNLIRKLTNAKHTTSKKVQRAEHTARV